MHNNRVTLSQHKADHKYDLLFFGTCLKDDLASLLFSSAITHSSVRFYDTYSGNLVCMLLFLQICYARPSRDAPS